MSSGVKCVVVCLSRIYVFVRRHVVEKEKDQNVQFREYEQNEPREIPPPSSVTYDDDEVSKYVASNLLNYVNNVLK